MLFYTVILQHHSHYPESLMNTSKPVASNSAHALQLGLCCLLAAIVLGIPWEEEENAALVANPGA